MRLPAVSHIRRAIRRFREETDHRNPMPDDRSNRVISLHFVLLYESGVGDQNRILLFGTNCTMITGSCTERPNSWLIFYQINSIHALVHERSVPCVFVILPTAAIGQVRAAFRRASVKGCFNKLAQNVHLKVQSKGLQDLYNNDDDFAVKRSLNRCACICPIDQLLDTQRCSTALTIKSLQSPTILRTISSAIF